MFPRQHKAAAIYSPTCCLALLDLHDLIPVGMMTMPSLVHVGGCRLNDEAEAHTDRMSVLDGTDEGEAAVSADAAAGGRISFIEHPRQMSLTDVGLTDLPFGPASSAATAAGEPLTRPAPELAYDHPQGPLSVWESQLGFTDAQLKVLESQILAYRRLRRLRKARDLLHSMHAETTEMMLWCRVARAVELLIGFSLLPRQRCTCAAVAAHFQLLRNRLTCVALT